MKDFWKSWKFWAIVAAVIVAIVLVVLYMTVPAFAEFVKSFVLYVVTALLGVAVGIGIGYFIFRKYGKQ